MIRFLARPAGMALAGQRAMPARISLAFAPLVALSSVLVAPNAAAQSDPTHVPGGVRVVLEAPEYTTGPSLDQKHPDGSWEELCSAPCTDATIDAHGTYRVRGGVVTDTVSCSDDVGGGTCVTSSPALDSGPFHIAPGPLEQHLLVDGASRRTRTFGWIFASLSALYFAPAGVAFAGGYGNDKSFNNIFRWSFGAPMAAGGAAFLITGIVFIAKSTHVKDEGDRVLGQVKLPHGIGLTPTGFVF
jgi:hypothetical protein